MIRDFDLIVIGAGPAGSRAALTAAASGLSVALIDEAPAAGGQVWRAPPAAFAARPDARISGDSLDGKTMRAELAASAVQCFFGRRVWNLRPGFEAHAVSDAGSEVFTGRQLVLSPGTTERMVPFENSTLPGVIGLAAATVLLKSQQMLPGRRTIIAGAGPLLPAVAVSILKGGGEIAAIVDLNSPLDWMRATPSMLGRPRLMAEGMGWIARIVAAGVPYYARHTIVAAGGGSSVESAVIAPVDGNWKPLANGQRRQFPVDAVVVGHGLTPSTEMSRLLGAEHRFDAGLNQWIPVVGEMGETSVEGLYIAGDATGVAGAAAAVEAGRLAGLAAAHKAGRLVDAAFRQQAATARRRWRSMAQFGRAMSGLFALRPGLVEGIAPQTVVCRCEDVSRAQIDGASRDGVTAIGQLKALTRCGMGPCQGRMCGDTVGTLMALNGVPRERFGQMVARPPLRPVSIGAISGEFDYSDLALPPSLPSS